MFHNENRPAGLITHLLQKELSFYTLKQEIPLFGNQQHTQLISSICRSLR